MRRIKILTLTLLAAICVAGCGNNNKKPVTSTNTQATKTSSTTAAAETEETQAPRVNYVRMEVITKEKDVEIQILDDENRKITGTTFTVCLVPSNGSSMTLDKTQSATIVGAEYVDGDGDGVLLIEELEQGSYEVYLRPIPTYMDANPIPISIIYYEYDVDISSKIHQSSEVNVEREDMDYVAPDVDEVKARENAVAVSNLMNSGFILGTSETFKVNKPLLNEQEEIMYEKLNSVEVDTSAITLSDYLKENNKVELIVGQETIKAYVYEEERFDQRVEEYYVSKAIVNKEGKYYLYTLVPHMTTGEEDIYVGWYSRKGKHFYNDEDGYPVSGWKKLDGLWYYFNENGQKASITGIDVSEYQEDINWPMLKESGVDFVIIRCGYRGYETGVLVEDAKFRENIQGATDAGIPFGVYIFSQAITPQEAAEEASMILELCKGYEPTLPFAIDIEACGDDEIQGRQNDVSVFTRTQVINTFVGVIESQGQEAMLYSNKSWLENQIDLSQVDCKIWYAMWPGEDAEDEENAGRAPNDDAYEPDETKVPDMEVEIWQYSDKGVVEGIEPLVDLNAWVTSTEE